MSYEEANSLIEALGNANPSGDPHGIIDPPFTKACRDFLAREGEPENPLTLAEWKNLTRERNDVDAAFKREILDAENALVFLVVLRDRLVFTAGCADVVISIISSVVDPHINPHILEWTNGQA